MKGGKAGAEDCRAPTGRKLRKQVSFESGFKQRKGRRISEVGWQRVPDRRCKKAEGTLSERFGVAFGTFRSFSHDE